MIQEQTGRLSHLAEILLDMTGIQTVERSETISLAELTEEVFCDLASVAEQKQIELIQRDGDCTVIGSYLLLYRAMGGAGLGLALVTEIARQHGGQVKVLESNEKGSTIALMLPL